MPPVDVAAAIVPARSMATAPTVPARVSARRWRCRSVTRSAGSQSSTPSARARSSAPGPTKKLWRPDSMMRRARVIGFRIPGHAGDRAVAERVAVHDRRVHLDRAGRREDRAAPGVEARVVLEARTAASTASSAWPPAVERRPRRRDGLRGCRRAPRARPSRGSAPAPPWTISAGHAACHRSRASASTISAVIVNEHARARTTQARRPRPPHRRLPSLPAARPPPRGRRRRPAAPLPRPGVLGAPAARLRRSRGARAAGRARPAAHGGNRTGRMFTGDRSGDWLFHALWKAGLLQPADVRARGRRPAPPRRLDHRGAAVRAARQQASARRDGALPAVPAGGAARCCRRARRRGAGQDRMGRLPPRAARARSARAPAAARASATAPKPACPTARSLLGTFHPSQQNTFTGKLTRPMLIAVLRRAHRLAR